tara:strand:+ start:382 stop:528 length:147 start_codon:yes stop_codon:yes gene_type:complete
MNRTQPVLRWRIKNKKGRSARTSWGVSGMGAEPAIIMTTVAAAASVPF